MSLEPPALGETDAPADAPIETLDVREAGPPEPLERTLETLADLPDGTVLVQYNDRAPQFLYPRLEERGYAYETFEDGGPAAADAPDDAADAVVTVVWSAEVDA